MRATSPAVGAVVSALVAASCASTTARSGGLAGIEVVPAIDRALAVAAAVDVRTEGCTPRGGFGTGTLVDEHLIITAAHVVAGTTAVTTFDADGVERDAAVVLFDPDLDIAVLRSVEPHPQQPMPLRSTRVEQGETGIAVLPRHDAASGEVEVEIATVEVVRRANIETTDIYLEVDVSRPGFEVRGDVDPGDSGAMVVVEGVDATVGGGVGIVWARSRRNEDRGWAIDLPRSITDPAQRSLLTESVDVGRCSP